MDQCSILLLDEDEDNYQLMKAILAEAFHGEVNLDWFQRDGFASVMICSGHYRLVIVECRLGVENGLDIIRQAKEQCPEQKLFLLTGADVDATLQARALQAGAAFVLQKKNLSVSLAKQVIAPYVQQPRCSEITT